MWIIRCKVDNKGIIRWIIRCKVDNKVDNKVVNKV